MSNFDFSVNGLHDVDSIVSSLSLDECLLVINQINSFGKLFSYWVYSHYGFVTKMNSSGELYFVKED